MTASRVQQRALHITKPEALTDDPRHHCHVIHDIGRQTDAAVYDCINDIIQYQTENEA